MNTDIKGLMVLYPQMPKPTKDRSKQKNDYLRTLYNDNSELIRQFETAGYATLWLPQTTLQSTSVEVWPFKEAKKKLVLVTVSVSSLAKDEKYCSITRDSFVNYVATQFRKANYRLVRQLETQGFMLHFNATNTSKQTRIAVY